MEQLFKSAGRLALSFSLLGVQQVANALHSPSTSIHQRWGAQSGDAVAPAPSVPSLNVVRPRWAARALIHLARHTAGLFACFAPPDDWNAAALEFHNKLTAFGLFEHFDQELGLQMDACCSLHDLLLKAESLTPYYKLWATEGLGHYYADLNIDAGTSDSLADLHQMPAHALVPLQAGIALSIAESILDKIDMRGKGHSTEALDFWNRACRASLLPGYEEIGYEALGLACRNLYPHAIPMVEHELMQISPEMADYFWHGVGRAIYFSPSNLSPHRSAPWKGLEACLEEPTSRSARLNAVAGFAWALVLVNIRHPEIMAAFLRHHGPELQKEADAFCNGIISALTIWRLSHGPGHYVQALAQYRAAAGSSPLNDHWRRIIGSACEAILAGGPAACKEPGKLFRYRPRSKVSERYATSQTGFSANQGQSQ